jgi:Mrp family chromosome partitioning ATPase
MIAQLAESYSEQFHELHRALFGIQETSGPTAVQFCASHFSEGVTTTTLAFASCLARTHGSESVIAVEANLRRPSFNQVLKITPATTLPDVLAGRASVESAIETSSSFGFPLVSAGSGVKSGGQTPVESMLDQLGQVLTDLKKRYRHIIIDSAPVIPFIDASIIASAVDKIALLVEAKVTRSEVVDRSIQKLKSGGGEISGIVLTKREFFIPKWIYRFL